MDSAELAYAAGFFDAEGSVGIYRYDPPDYYHVMCGLFNTAQVPLDWFKSRWGGRLQVVTSTLSHRPGIRLNFRSGETLALLSAIQPYLITKRARAEAALAFLRLTFGRGWNRQCGRPLWLRARQTRLFERQRAPSTEPPNGCAEPNLTDVAYAAGLLDGDGYVGITCHNPQLCFYSPRCSISSIDLAALRWLQARWSGGIHPVRGNYLSRRPGWQWTPTHRGMLPFFRQIKPYLLVKAHAVELAEEMVRMQLGKPYEHRPTVIRERQIQLYAAYMQSRGHSFPAPSALN